MHDTLQERLLAYEDQKLWRHRNVIHQRQEKYIVVNNKRCLNFAANDYLGLSQHPQIIKAYQDAIQEFGVSTCSSTFIAGYSYFHQEFEQQFAKFLNCERAVYFCTGYMANIGVLTSLINQSDIIFSDRYNHISINDGIRLSKARFMRYNHNDSADLEKRLLKSHDKQKFVITESVFSMNGQIIDLPKFVEIAQINQAVLMIDDAHGIAVLGEKGAGVCDYYNVDPKNIDLLICPLSKGFGTIGAIVAGKEKYINALIQFAKTYMFTTAQNPAALAAGLSALKIVQEEKWRREKLETLINYFKLRATNMEFNFLPSQTPIQSLIIKDNERAVQIARSMQERGLLISAIRPPSVPKGTTRLRIILNSLLEIEDVENLLKNLQCCHASENWHPDCV
jgi:8-amino-7-oxononanoate synthase